MSELCADLSELLPLFPRNFSGLYVVTKNAQPDKLSIRYIQRHAPDSYRNWDSYRAWEKINETHIEQQEGHVKTPLDLPADFDTLYHSNMDLIEAGIISKDDRILLAADTQQLDSSTPLCRVGLYLSWLRRHKDLLSGELAGISTTT